MSGLVYKGIDLVSVPTTFRLEFGTVLTVLYIYMCVLLVCKQSLKSNIFQNIIVPCHIYWFQKCIVAGYFKKNNGLAIVQEIYKS